MTAIMSQILIKTQYINKSTTSTDEIMTSLSIPHCTLKIISIQMLQIEENQTNSQANDDFFEVMLRDLPCILSVAAMDPINSLSSVFNSIPSSKASGQLGSYYYYKN